MYFIDNACVKLNEFKTICEQKTDRTSFPLAQDMVNNVLVYGGNQLRKTVSQNRKSGLEEIHSALKDGPGVIVIKEFYSDPQLMDRGSELFYQIIFEESQLSKNRGDHFSKGSPNARIWNVMEKILDADPNYFYDYFKNPLLSFVSEAWLGPAYQMTAQVNLVRPGSAAQTTHRDYHLGFLDDEVIIRYPTTAQVMSQYLTLQGAVAHCNMPLESGPTLLLPHSQKYIPGYVAMRRDDFIQYFNKHAVQNELHKGDALFFSPALFHAAGENSSKDIDRMGNLLQISSSFGKPMEKINFPHMAEKVYPLLLKKIQELPSPQITPEMEAVIQIAASGYPFPSDLDKMHPKPNSLTPTSDQDIIRSHLLSESPPEVFLSSLNG